MSSVVFNSAFPGSGVPSAAGVLSCANTNTDKKEDCTHLQTCPKYQRQTLSFCVRNKGKECKLQWQGEQDSALLYQEGADLSVLVRERREW